MTKVQAAGLIMYYAGRARELDLDPIISEIDRRYFSIVNPDTEKTMRWLGFCQGYLVREGIFTLDEVCDHAVRARLSGIRGERQAHHGVR